MSTTCEARVSVVFETGAIGTAYRSVYQRPKETTMRTRTLPASLIPAMRLAALIVLAVLAAACGKGTGGY